ncbi:MAG: SIS domain-containing protein, partial [Nanoarchaeota archaeon]|nr:SIS domain-containing protein [Nanoarchaeota archaeon]
ALKIKEITYIHSEGMMAGELKHGTLALIEKGVPVIALIPNNNAQMTSNTKEVESRGAYTISIINKKTDYKADFEFVVPQSSDVEFGLYAVIIGQLLTYYIGLEKKLPIDKPRNLAKSVTVE